METKDNIKQEEKYYVPICREYGCNGNLVISIDEYLFQVNCFCEKNNNHNYKLYFDTFDKFYMKEKIIKRCYNCFNKIDNKMVYNCNKCNQLFCSNCFISDKHIKENLNNLKIIKNVCPKDDHELTEYCIDCGIKLCAYCLKSNLDNNHKGHTIKNISENIPSKEHIDDIKQKIADKSKYYENLIKLLDEWLSKLNKKIEQLKYNLLSEIKILNKLFSNFNFDYNEFAYYENYFRIVNDLDNNQNRFLRRFMETRSFEEKTFNIYKILSIDEHEPLIIDAKTKKVHKLMDFKILDNLSDEIMLISDEESIGLMKLNEDGGISIDEENKIKFPKISTFFVSKDKTKIYAIPDGQNVINIFNYNHEKNTLLLIYKNIPSPSNEIKKFELIDENYLFLMDDNYIYLLTKNNCNNFLCTNEKFLAEILFDECKVDDKYIIVSHQYHLTFIKIENLIEEKVILNVDCIEDNNNLTLIKDFVLVNCYDGIAIISIKNKEMIQYIEMDNRYSSNKIIKKSSEDLIYIWRSYNNVYAYIFDDYELKLVKVIHCLKEDNYFLKYSRYLKFTHRDFFITGKDLVIYIHPVCFIIDGEE